VSADVLLVLLALHFVGHFLLQSDEMALNKSRSWRWLYRHVGAYITPFALVAGGLMLSGYWNDAETVSGALVLAMVAHFLQDAATSRWTSRLWFIEMLDRAEFKDSYYPERFGAYPFYARVIPDRRHWFFVVIGFDQLLHAVQLGLTYKWLLTE
jgi:hypothetical protein